MSYVRLYAARCSAELGSWCKSRYCESSSSARDAAASHREAAMQDMSPTTPHRQTLLRHIHASRSFRSPTITRQKISLSICSGRCMSSVAPGGSVTCQLAWRARGWVALGPELASDQHE